MISPQSQALAKIHKVEAQIKHPEKHDTGCSSGEPLLGNLWGTILVLMHSRTCAKKHNKLRVA